MPHPKALIWMRRDLRLEDHSALAFAESEGLDCALAFVFDDQILRPLPKDDRRVSFFHAALQEIDEELRERGSCLLVRTGDPAREIPILARKLGVSMVIATKDYEPKAIERDAAVAAELRKQGIELRLLKDQVIFEGREILNGSNAPYQVFTAYKNAWLKVLEPRHYEKRGRRLPKLLARGEIEPLAQRWELDAIGFRAQKLWLDPGPKAATSRFNAFTKNISEYCKARDFPGVEGTSGLSAHLRFGTISIRGCVRAALESRSEGAKVWLSELIWRDFYFMILSEFPHVGRGEAFRREYNGIRWPGRDEHFEAWKEGRTGFPIVDAAMRHFNETGWMHNRLRMVVASFLVKDLLIDWRRGEEVFARGLLDFDLSANNGGWQWSASTGCDAQPYFRVFNPYSQSKKFDPEGEFLRKHLPELSRCQAKEIHEPSPLLYGYPAPIVEHAKQRERAIALFKKG